MPFGLDTNIPLSFRAPAPIDPLEGYQKVQQIQQAQQNAALMPLKVQEAQLAIQQGQLGLQHTQAQIDQQKVATEQAKQDQKDRQDYAQAMTEANGDADKMEELLPRYAKSPQVAAQIMQHIAETRKYKEQTDAAQQKKDLLIKEGYAQGLDSILQSTDPTATATQWAQLATQANAAKNAKGEPLFGGQQFDPNTVPDPQTITTLRNAAAIGTDFLKKKADADEAAGKIEAQRLKTLGATKEDLASTLESLQADGLLTPEKYAEVLSDPKYKGIKGNFPGQLSSDKRTADQTLQMFRSAADRANGVKPVKAAYSADLLPFIKIAQDDPKNAGKSEGQILAIAEGAEADHKIHIAQGSHVATGDEKPATRKDFVTLNTAKTTKETQAKAAFNKAVKEAEKLRVVDPATKGYTADSAAAYREAVLAAARENLNTFQSAQNLYEQNLGALGVESKHFEYPSAEDWLAGGGAAPVSNIPPMIARRVAPQAKQYATVKMKAPNGQVQDVPADQVAHFESIGATRVK